MNATEPSKKKKKFGDWAVELGFMTDEEVEQVLFEKNISNQLFGQLCMEKEFINDQELAQIMAAQYTCEYVAIESIEIPEIVKKINVDLMTRHMFVPYRLHENTLEIAMADPMDYYKVVDELEMLLDLDIRVVVASKQNIAGFIKRIDTSSSVLDSVSGEMYLPIVKESDEGESVLSVETVTTEESPIVKLVDSTILDAINKRASDIHVETTDSGLLIRYRIDGMLHQATDPIDVQFQSPVVSRIKVMSELDISEKRIPQDGRFKLKVRDRYIDFRVSILPSILGENVVIRILDRDSMVSSAGEFKLEGMNIPEYEYDRMRKMIHAPYGMFLMTGPTGSGKTTTLYRAISEVNTKDIKIITIEDPVEYQLKGVTQIPVNTKKGLTFARGLRSILRHDPDKILVGEIRDQETAEIALQSALTGHLVFTTVHANSSFEVINRFTHMGIQPYDLMAALNCIVAQRLIRVLCDCKAETKIPENELIDSGLSPDIADTHSFYKASGCENCKGTGYSGRKAIIELIVLDDRLKEMFISRAPTSEQKRRASETGTTFLRGAAIHEVLSGVTTLEEANRVTFIETQ